jgi:hypothetical protein
MIRLALMVFAIASSPACADKYEDWARDFIVIRERTEACFETALTYADAAACAGKASAECRGEAGTWPHPEPRDCRNEINVWEAIYRKELRDLLQAANNNDIRDLYYDSALYAGDMWSFIAAEQAWQGYGGVCSYGDLAAADLSYLERQKLPPDYCREGRYAERIFYLRSERNWLNFYRKPKGD